MTIGEMLGLNFADAELDSEIIEDEKEIAASEEAEATEAVEETEVAEEATEE